MEKIYANGMTKKEYNAQWKRDNPEKCKNDPYSYFARMVNNAFIQSWRKCKTYTDNNVIINYELMYQDNEWSDSQENRPDMDSVTPDLNRLDWGHF